MKKLRLITAMIGLIFVLPPLSGHAANRWVESTSIEGADIWGITSLDLDHAWAISGNSAGGIYSFNVFSAR